jgi:ferredoxin
MIPKQVKQVGSCPVTIFIAGDGAKALEVCRSYCDEVGYCVTVTPTTYVYRDGQEAGVIIGLINYPRFPADLDTIAGKAIALAKLLRVELGQDSFCIQTPETTTWCSWRALDGQNASDAPNTLVTTPPEQSPDRGTND